MKVRVYMDLDDPAIDEDAAKSYFADRVSMVAGEPKSTILVDIRRDARLTGKRPMIVIDGGLA